MRLAAMLVTLAAGVGAAQAEDLPVADWNGFYAGVFAGYGLDREADTSSSTSGTYPAGGGALYEVTYDSSRSRVETALGGVRAGYNFQSGNIVLGTEAGVMFGNFGKQSVANSDWVYDDDDVGPDDDSFHLTASSVRSFDSTVAGTLEAKLGVALGDWLLYGKGGLAVAEGTATGRHTMTGSGPGLGNVSVGSYDGDSSASALLFGTTFSLGAEAMVSEQLSFGIEVGMLSLADLVADDFTEFPTVVPMAVAEQIGPVSIYTAKVGMNYHFK